MHWPQMNTGLPSHISQIFHAQRDGQPTPNRYMSWHRPPCAGLWQMCIRELAMPSANLRVINVSGCFWVEEGRMRGDQVLNPAPRLAALNGLLVCAAAK